MLPPLTHPTRVGKQDAWDFIVARYGELTPDESKHLHERQDEQGLDIVLHFFQAYAALWLGRSLTPDEVGAAESLVADWRADVVWPLRRLRRALKDRPGSIPGLKDAAQVLRARMAQAELDAEQAELHALCDWLAGRA